MGGEPDPLLGRIISERYEIVSLINSGGMGVVYRAKQRSLDRPVAIKFIHPQFLAAEGAVERFMEEARAVSRMNHPHVVSVFDFGRTPAAEGGYLFLVMELLGGPDLAKVLAHEHPLALRRVGSIIVQTLEALAEAHHLGIVHRDVKPENIVLEPTRSGQEHVKVIDFGIAKVGATGGAAAAVCGTPTYMAPEQKSGVAGPAADIYSTGVMLFEMLTGQLPPTEVPPLSDPGSTFHLDPRKVAPRRGITEPLAAACMRALHQDPERRFPDAQSFAQAVRTAMAGLMPGGEPAPGYVGATPLPTSTRRALSPTLPGIATRDSVATASLPGVSTGREPRGGAAFVGREDDLEWACALLQSDQPPPAIAFWGRPGIGRTRLVREVAAAAEEDGTLVVSLGLPPHPSSEVGYVGLRHVVRALSGLTPAELMDDRALGAVDRWALTGLRVLFSRAKAPSEPQVARRTADAALAWGMARAAERAENGRVLLVLDDLDRLDGSSLLALRDRLRSEPLSWHAGQSGGPASAQASARAPSPGVTVLATSQHARTVVQLTGVRERMLRGFSRDDALAMLESLGRPALLPRVEDDIAPLYVMEVAACDPATVTSLPSTLDELVGRRIQALSMVQRRILQALGVVGVHVVESLGSLLRHPGELDSALDALVSAGFVERRGAHVLLRHQIYGTVALANAPAGAVAAIHKAAAHELRDARQLTELRAYHAIHGSADFEAFVLLEEVARQRSARGDDEGAIQSLSQAVSAARGQVLLGETQAASAALGLFGRRLAVALVAVDRLEEAQAVLDEVLRVAEPRALLRAAVLEQLGTIAELQGNQDDAHKRWREALEIAERTDDQKLIARLHAALEGKGLPPAPRPPEPSIKPAAATPPSEPRPVLIVEDDRSIREGLQSVLESEGYQAFGASNGREALELLRKIPRPGLILLDLMMPVMSGWEVLEALRVDEEFATIPVVVVSAVSERNKVAASRVLRKPVEVGMLLGIVEEFCG
jgi:serine/threonine-protein kinase